MPARAPSRASGTLGLGGGDLPVALQVTAHGARPFASDLLTATIDMDLKISGGLRSQLSADRQRADRSCRYQHSQCAAARRGGAERGACGREAGADGEDQCAHRGAGSDGGRAARRVRARPRRWMRNWAGSCISAASSNDPDISGGFDLRNGTVNLAGATLTFTSGRVGFNGTGVKKKIDPTLDFSPPATPAAGHRNAERRRLRRCAGDHAEQHSGNAAG